MVDYVTATSQSKLTNFL